MGANFIQLHMRGNIGSIEPTHLFLSSSRVYPFTNTFTSDWIIYQNVLGQVKSFVKMGWVGQIGSSHLSKCVGSGQNGLRQVGF